VNEIKEYDLVVIGSGPAGEKAALQAAYYQKTVCVIDRGPPGGAWVNTGTIPSKTLRESAIYLTGGRRRGMLSDPSAMPTVRSFMAMKRHLVARWREKIERNFRRLGDASLLDSHSVRLDNGDLVRGRYLLIATGSRPRAVPALPVDGVRVHDSETILHLEEIPHSMVVLGGGVIACEYASIFQALGVQVTLVNGRDRLLGFLDPEVSGYLEQALVHAGVQVRHNASAVALRQYQQGETEVCLDDGTAVAAETLFVALGRIPALQGLGLEAVGVALTDWGTVQVSPEMRSSVANIFAAGDVVGFPSLASAGMEQGRLAAARMFERERGPVDELIPNGIFTIPEVSSVGMSERQAREAGLDPVQGSAGYQESVRAPMLSSEEGFVKLIADRASGRLLGATIVGNQATELIHFAMAVIKYQGHVRDLVHFVFNLPSLSALYRQAAYQVLPQLWPDGADETRQ
jgi:NAD(P) transhydrogenase